MIETGNQNLGRFLTKLYSDSTVWLSLQIVFGTFPAAYLIQNPVRHFWDSVQHILISALNLQLLTHIAQLIISLSQITALLLLIIFFIIPKSLNSVKNQLFTFTLISLIPHSWTMMNPNLIKPFSDPLLNYLFFISPVFVAGLNIHKYMSEKPSEVQP